MDGVAGPLRRAGPDDAGSIVAVLADAFDGDPFFRWMFGPEEIGFRSGVRAWLDLIVGLALPRGRGFLAANDGGAVVWLPPGVELTDTKGLAAVGRFLDELIGDRVGEVLGAIGSGGSGVPAVPHWLCLYIGVRPDAQGRGLGRALLHAGLDAADASSAPAHLVATNPATASFYERFGFRALGEIVAEPGVPPLRPMWRNPVRRG